MGLDVNGGYDRIHFTQGLIQRYRALEILDRNGDGRPEIITGEGPFNLWQSITYEPSTGDYVVEYAADRPMPREEPGGVSGAPLFVALYKSRYFPTVPDLRVVFRQPLAAAR